MIAANILHANQLLILAAIYQGITPLLQWQFQTWKMLHCMKLFSMLFIWSYDICCFVAKYLLVGIKFQCLQGIFKSHYITFNKVSSKECVPEIKRYICIIKERYQTRYSMLPFFVYPSVLLLSWYSPSCSTSMHLLGMMCILRTQSHYNYWGFHSQFHSPSQGYVWWICSDIWMNWHQHHKGTHNGYLL